MAEMTTEQVKTLLESFAAVCGSNSKAKELCSDAIKFVEQQAQEIAAANARIAELKKQKPSYKKEFDCVYEKLKAEESLSKHYKKRAARAEAKAKQLIKKLTYNTPSFRDGKCDEELLTIDENELVPLKSCMCDRLKQAEAQCNQMEADCADFQAIIKRLQEENAKRFNDNTAMHERMMGAEAQNKRMREALDAANVIVGNLENETKVENKHLNAFYRAKAALEEKP